MMQKKVIRLRPKTKSKDRWFDEVTGLWIEGQLPVIESEWWIIDADGRGVTWAATKGKAKEKQLALGRTADTTLHQI